MSEFSYKKEPTDYARLYALAEEANAHLLKAHREKIKRNKSAERRAEREAMHKAAAEKAAIDGAIERMKKDEPHKSGPTFRNYIKSAEYRRLHALFIKQLHATAKSSSLHQYNINLNELISAIKPIYYGSIIFILNKDVSEKVEDGYESALHHILLNLEDELDDRDDRDDTPVGDRIVFEFNKFADFLEGHFKHESNTLAYDLYESIIEPYIEMRDKFEMRHDKSSSRGESSRRGGRKSKKTKSKKHRKTRRK
jgi:hypothetical protein